MSNQDREAAIGRLLTAMQEQSHSAASPACLDAESLAAWAENQLTPAQRSAAESHVASCPRCQSTLGALARTATAADTAAREEQSRSRVFRFAPWMAALGGAAVVALMVVTTQPRTEQTQAEPTAVSPDSTHDRLEAAKESPSEPLPVAGAAPAPSRPVDQ